MRIRQVKPAFWQDAKLAALSHETRLFYIGLWMLADDEGWLRWDVSQIGAELYPFEARHSRERRIQRMAEQIRHMEGDEKLVLHPCGHAVLPRLAAHQHLAGTTRRVTTMADEHQKCPSPRLPADDGGLPRLPATPRDSPPRIGKVGIGKVGIGKVGIGNGSVSAPAGAEEPRGLKTHDETTAEQIARLQRKLADPTVSEAVKESVRFQLQRLPAA